MTVDAQIAEQAKRRASLVSLLAVLFLVILKVIVGLVTGSLGILAQVADSVLDLIATLLAFFAVRIADQPADAGHPYGHGKVENLAALAETGLLLFTCGWIAYEAVQRLFFHPVPIESGLWGVAVMVLSIAVSLALSTYLLRVARRYRSQSLEGNALNFRTDVLSSSVVLLGLVLVSLSQWLGPEWAWLTKADPLAALFVALMVLRTSLGLGRQAVHELLDAAPPGLAERVTAAAGATPGVQEVGPVRVRRSGASTFVDLAIQVERSASLEEAHRIASEVEGRLAELVGRGDIVVHVDPVRREGETLPQTVGAIAARFGLRVHNVHAHEAKGHYCVDLDVEVPPELTLAQAHAQVSEMEAAVRRELPHVSDVHTHIEPQAVPLAVGEPEGNIAEVQARVQEIAEKVAGLRRCHEFQIRVGPEGYDVAFHCLADPNLPIEQVHRLADKAERQIYAALPEVHQVLIHMEPEEPA